MHSLLWHGKNRTSVTLKGQFLGLNVNVTLKAWLLDLNANLPLFYFLLLPHARLDFSTLTATTTKLQRLSLRCTSLVKVYLLFCCLSKFCTSTGRTSWKSKRTKERKTRSTAHYYTYWLYFYGLGSRPEIRKGKYRNDKIDKYNESSFSGFLAYQTIQTKTSLFYRSRLPRL